MRKPDFHRVWRELKPHINLIIVALALLASLDLIGRAISIEWPRNPGVNSDPTSMQYYWPIPPSCRDAGSIRDASVRQAKIETCERERERYRMEQANLQQMWFQSTYAEEALKQTWQQTRISFMGTLLTVAALFASAWAAVASSRAAKSAQEAVKHDRQTARLQLRAYLHIEEMRVSWQGENSAAAFKIELRNTGQTPAIWFEAYVQSAIYHPGEDFPEAKPFPAGSRWSTFIGASSTRSLRAYPAIDQVTRADITSPHQQLVAIGLIRYADIFDEVHELPFTCFNPHVLKGETKMMFTTER